MVKSFSADDEKQVYLVLENHLKAAAMREPDAFFGIFAPDAFFVGTDDTEQWYRDELIDKLNESPSGWDMTDCPQRHFFHAPENPEVVTFFEVLKHKTLGTLRGSGVVIKHYGKWMILQYVLSFSVPNEVADKVNFLEMLACPEPPPSSEIDDMCEVPG